LGIKLGLLLAIFAAGYLLSSLLRGVTAALAPIFTGEFGVSPAELGLLAAAYFASFAVLQLPMGAWLDRYGVRAVLVASLVLAAVSCMLFAAAESFDGLFWVRLLSGIGVSACLVAPLTAARLWTDASQQQRTNSWMLMAGALGLILGTLPAESIAASLGWRPLFVGLGVCFALVCAMVGTATPKHRIASGGGQSLFGSYGPIARRPYTWSIGSMGLLNYAILVAVQTLWMGPWLTNLGGLDSGVRRLGCCTSTRSRWSSSW
jgi:MFS family permease